MSLTKKTIQGVLAGEPKNLLKGLKTNDKTGTAQS